MAKRLSSDKIPFVNLTITNQEESWEEIKTILLTVKPEWAFNNIRTKSLTGGYVGITTAYFPQTGAQNEGLVIKTLQEYYVGPMAELQSAYKFLNDSELIPPIRAFFNNGYCQDYQPGKTPGRLGPEILTEEYWKPVIEELAYWHSDKIIRQAQDFGLRHLPAHIFPIEKEYKKIMNRAPMNAHKNDLPTMEQILHEETILVEQMQKRGAFKPNLHHGDLNPSNFLLHQGRAYLMDCDYCSIYVEEMDLIGLIYSILDPLLPDWSLVPNEEFQIEILGHYNKTLQALNEDKSERDVIGLFHDVQCALPLFYIKIITCAVFLGSVPDADINWLNFSKQLWREYHTCKEQAMKRRDEYYGYKETGS